MLAPWRRSQLRVHLPATALLLTPSFNQYSLKSTGRRSPSDSTRAAHSTRLSVFIGGGRANNNVTEVTNGSVQIDLSNSSVNANRLGLQGVQAIGVAGTDISTSSATTSVQAIVGDATNLASLSQAGFTDFFFAGPGFGGDNKARLSINLSGVVDTTTLAAAINSAIAGFTAASASGQAFKNADIKAVINTDTTGKQQLAFTSANSAFQVQAGDLVSNALLGNFSAGPVGASLTVRVRWRPPTFECRLTAAGSRHRRP